MQSRRYNKHSKDISLEALRGLAAVSVLFWHNMLGFFPENAGAFPNMDAHKAINTSVFFGFINGLAAVVSFLFFLDSCLRGTSYYRRSLSDFSGRAKTLAPAGSARSYYGVDLVVAF